MFYSNDILQYRRGRFATVWLAATKVSKLTRRDIMSVNINSACDALLDYLYLRMAPSTSGKRPRLSLYLSSVLMHGVVKVYSKQHDYLLSDISSIFCKLVSKFQVVKDIDLVEKPSAQMVTFPEYGVDDLMPLNVDVELFLLDTENLRDMHTIEYWGSSSSDRFPSPQISTSSTSSSRKRRKVAEEQGDVAPSVSSIDQITLREAPTLRLEPSMSMSPIPVPRDIELPMLDGREMELLMGEEPPLQVSDLLPTSTPLNLATDRPRRTRHSRQGPGSDSLEGRNDQDKQPPAASTESLVEVPNQELLERSPQPTAAAMTVPERRAVAQSPGVTMNITSPLPRRPNARHSLHLDTLAEQTNTPRGTPRRKRKFIVDEQIQVPNAKIKENIESSQQTCAELLLPNVHAASAADLLDNPGRKELRREPFLSLWKRSARFRRNIQEEDMPNLRSPSPVREPEIQPNLESLLQEQPLDITMETLRQEVSQNLLTMPVSPVLPDTAEKRRGKKRTSTVDESIEKLRQITSMSEASLELNRDASINLSQPGPEDTLVLEESRRSQRDKSSSKKKRSLRSGSSDDSLLQEAASLTNLQLSTAASSSTHRGLYDVVEEQEPGVVPALTHEQPDTSVDELARTIQNEVHRRPEGDESITFSQLFPPRVIDRKTASHNFSNLLVLCKEMRVKTEQSVYGGDILIWLV